jgi:hypothetical protein
MFVDVNYILMVDVDIRPRRHANVLKCSEVFGSPVWVVELFA